MMNETVITVDRQVQQSSAGGPGGKPTVNATTTTTTTTSTNPNPLPGAGAGGALSWLQFNYQYFIHTIPGYLKLAQLILGILCMALASPAYIGATHWFLFVAVTSFIASLMWTFVYLLGIREVLNLAVNWILTEFINLAIATLLYFIAFIVQLAAWSNIGASYPRGSNIAAGVFGLFNTLVYAASTYLLYVEHRSTLPR